MNWFKRDPWLAGLIGAVFISISGEGWRLWRVRAEAISAVSMLEQKNREREGFKTQSPAPTEDGELAVERDLENAQKKLAEMETGLIRADGSGTEISTLKPTDAYFEIASFVEKTRALALQAHVAVRADEHFGFASYASEGPAAHAVPAVLRQRATIQVLLEALLAAEPAALAAVQRERPVASASRGGLDDSTDFFEFAPIHSFQKAGILEADAFKVEFTGQTRVLREFLNRLLASDPTFAVRAVEAEPVSVKAGNIGSTVSPGAVTPIIVEGLSRFRVVVERLRPVLGAEKETR